MEVVERISLREIEEGRPEEEQRRIIVGLFGEFRDFRELLKNPVAESDEAAPVS